MNKAEFLARLSAALSFLPESDVERSLEYYSELIDDYIDDGVKEQDAVAAVGSIDEIVKTIISEIPLPKLVKQKIKPKRAPKALEVCLLLLGSPVWLPVAISLIAVFLAVYAVLCVVIITLYAVDLSLAASAVGMLISAIFLVSAGNLNSVIFMIGSAFVCLGVAVLLFFAFNLMTKGILLLSKKMLLAIKTCFAGKGKNYEEI